MKQKENYQKTMQVEERRKDNAMLKVQEYLKSGKTLDDLKEEYGIKYKWHPTLPIFIVNYDSLKSPKMHEITCECRGLVLDENFDVVARGFGRFFNYSEALEITDKFRWDLGFEAFEKLDGSYINCFFYGNQWIMSTRGSWGEEEVGFSGRRWDEMVWRCIPRGLLKAYGTNINYIFEFVSIHNKIVRMYDKMDVVLLGATVVDISDTVDGCYELPGVWLDIVAKEHNVTRPITYQFTGYKGIEKFLMEQEQKDPTFEGLVVRDSTGLRLKIKSSTYCALHHLKGEGDNMYNVKYIVPLILAGETEELLAYFPEAGSRFEEVKQKIDEAYLNLWHVWYESQQFENQKLFAEYVNAHTPFSSILFRLRKNQGKDQPTDCHLREEWYKSTQLILKVLFNK